MVAQLSISVGCGARHDARLRRQIALMVLLVCGIGPGVLLAAAQEDALRITSNFASEQAVNPIFEVEFRTSRPLRNEEGRLAVFIENTERSRFFTPAGFRFW